MAYILVIMKHLAMKQDISHKKGRLCLWQLFMSVSCFMLMRVGKCAHALYSLMM